MSRETDAFEAARELFDALCDLPPAEREAHLAAAGARDAALRLRVEALLARDGAPHVGLDRSPVTGLARPAPEEPLRLPERLGPYEIVRVLGVGGMGVVYEALQPALGRRVALKLVRTALLGEDQRRRAQQEASLLGRLRHPGIATIYEVGQAHLDGVLHPYLAMELVAGQPIDAHARERALDVRARLALVARVARAVHHAHEHGVLHRDLKPGNVLVDEAGEPRVLDFGVARLLARDGSTTVTAPGTIVGTLGYMSPEQISGAAAELDARSDVYALGVILHELLAGRLPHEVADLPLPEAARRICELAPAPLGPLGLGPAAQGDLETIVETALARERERRYPSAAALADDLERFLRHEPIAARPASTFYHLRLFARRNRALVASSSLALLALLAGALVAGWMALREADLRRLAEERGRESERLAYRSNVIAAALALEGDNPDQARRLLADVHPPETPWELARLQRQLDEWLARIEHGLGRVWHAGFTRNGQEIVAISSQGGLAAWDVESGARTLVLADDPSRAHPLALSRDCERVLSVSGSEVRLWSTRDGALLGEWSAPSTLLADARGTATFAGDGTRVALSATDGRLLVLEPARDAWLGPFASGIPALDAHGERLVSANGPRVRVWELPSGPLRTLAGPPGDTRAVALDLTGQILALATSERGLHLLALADGSWRTLALAMPDVATALAFDPTGRFLAAMLEDGSVWLWDVAEGRLRHRFLVGESSWKTSLAWSPDGDRLVSAAHASRVLHLWDGGAALEPEVLRGHTSYVYPVAYALGGERIASGSWDGTLRLWSARTSQCVATLRPHERRVQALAASTDGTRIASGSPDGSLVVLDAASGAELARHRAETNWNSLAWSGDGLLAAGTAGQGAGVHLFGPDGLAPRASLELGSDVAALAFHPLRARLAVATTRRLQLLQPDGLATLAALDGPAVKSLAFSPDGRVLATGDTSGRIVLRDAETLAALRTLTGHRQEVFGLAWAPGGERLFSGGRDRLLRVWSPASGDLLAELAGHGDYVWSVAVSPDGKRVLTGSGDHTVRQWESEPARVSFERRRAE